MNPSNSNNQNNLTKMTNLEDASPREKAGQDNDKQDKKHVAFASQHTGNYMDGKEKSDLKFDDKNDNKDKEVIDIDPLSPDTNDLNADNDSENGEEIKKKLSVNRF